MELYYFEEAQVNAVLLSYIAVNVYRQSISLRKDKRVKKTCCPFQDRQID